MEAWEAAESAMVSSEDGKTNREQMLTRRGILAGRGLGGRLGTRSAARCR
jgi:hypothetical protein